MNQLPLAIGDIERREWDVVVVGAGPAGGMSAYLLARSGCSVLLVDKQTFPRYKVCGCHFNPSALATLRHAGLDTLMRENGAILIDELCVASSGRSATMRLPGSRSLSRSVFDKALAMASVGQGAVFLQSAKAESSSVENGFRRIVLTIGESTVIVCSRILIAADGLGGTLLRKSDAVSSKISSDSPIGGGAISSIVPAFYRPNRIYMACGRGGYLGIQSLEDGTLDLGTSLHTGYARACGGLGAAASAILKEAGLPDIPGIIELPWKGVPELTRAPERRTAERAFAVGDAAGYVEPFTGEGIAWSLSGAAALAPIVQHAILSYGQEHAEEWEQTYRHTIANRQFVIKALAKGLRKPALVNVAIAALYYTPFLAQPLIRMVSTPVELR